MAWGPGSSARGLAQDNLRSPSVAVFHQQSRRPRAPALPAPQPDAPQALLLLLSFPVCRSVTRQE